jgi:hypothetical protein
MMPPGEARRLYVCGKNEGPESLELSKDPGVRRLQGIYDTLETFSACGPFLPWVTS